MPFLNVSPALCNPYTADIFDVHRTVQRINQFGEVRSEITRIRNVRGVVYPEGDEDLRRRPEAQLNAKTIVVITRFALRGESTASADDKDYQPDILKWHSNHFLVERVEDYSSFATGFVKCTARSWDMVDQSS